jgi:glycosyltransferase involved in cell wall biosynthesis
MKILAVHNYYQQRGGEDQCFEDMVDVLQKNGHHVVLHTRHNESIHWASKLSVAASTSWNWSEFKNIGKLIRREKPDLVHAMNTFPLLSPSIFYAAKREKVPVVFEVQNYRLSCAGALLLRNDKICETCLHSALPFAAIAHRCYRNSAAGSATLASSIVLHRLLRTWQRVVDLFLCPSQVCKTKLIESGLPAGKIRVKPNVLNFDPGMGDGPQPFVVFVGRLSEEKGLSTAIKAWQENADLPVLKVIGDGPLAGLVQHAQQHDPRIQWLGRLPIETLVKEVGSATCLIMPSIWYEPFGRTTIEAMAKGTPVVGSRIGGTAEIIDDGVTGWLFEPGNAEDLAAKVRTAMAMPTDRMAQFRTAARQEFLNKYTADRNYEQLMAAYETVIPIVS